MFKFKKFSIFQENTPMKVCTDSCLFGALIDAKNHQKILDIGTGTGLLTLMLAQKSEFLNLTAVEIDENAVKDASLNIANSPFSKQIKIANKSIQEFTKASKEKFDLIVSNPPFFQNNLKSPKEEINLAHHNSSLSFEDLALSLHNLISEDGKIWILLPPFEMNGFLKICTKYQLFLNKKYGVKHDETKPIFREIIELSRQENLNPAYSEINIYENKQYSPIFVKLLKDYYLIF
ncbi:methyltransferase domain-containing protein [Lacihabitans sp. LS3-19]|uniref:tRNA1(Val) (adenine(37)-N6)-methyltransferase n=1 Tax=Lacihabitans sp. LS3-19 TaxID=2487335 RepID=UPI0020CC62C4|nr:methyltransferase [Lacihabitans sp. LS3-19]MCP9768742.1 methyltransferase domain-containing protein [Lacihabitans sp. LS3-19]